MNGRLHKHLFILLIVILFSVGCGGNDAGPTPTVDPAQAMQAAIQATIAAEQNNRGEQLIAWQSELDAAEKLWQDQNISSYTIVVAYTPSHTVNQSIYTLTVENGEIVDDSSTCAAFGTNLTCIIEQIDLDTLTVPGLFANARNALANDTINDSGNRFNFHDVYGVPQFILLQPTGQYPWFWQVNSIEVVE